jgi:hypothetical protein
MKIIVKGIFDRDVDKVRGKEIRHALDNKISQIEKAKKYFSGNRNYFAPRIFTSL